MKNTLKKTRTEKGFTQEAVARELKITTRMYQYFEAGSTEPRISQAFAMSDILGAPLEELFIRQE